MLFACFLNDRRASAVPLFALAAIPLVGLIGASVDYSRAAAVRTALQSAADSTSLALAKSAASLSSQQLQINAAAYFNGVFARADAATPTVTVSYTTSGGSQVVVNATSSVNTMFMGLMGFPQLPVAATSTSTWGNSRLRVALVLDNTGSMSLSGKMTALKSATHNLLNQLQAAAANPGDVYVSIVPFTKDVNVGTGSSSASWIDWTEWDAANGTWSNTGTKHNPNWVWTPASHSDWNGCVTDRDQNYDTLNTAPTSGALFPAEQYSVCPTALVPLSYDWTALNNKIDAMVAAGNTNQPIGLVWGWQSLTSGSPLDPPAEDASYKYQHIIIILSDGLNTQDRWYTSQTSIDNRQRILCDNIKAATPAITIYTVQVNTGGDPTSALLQYCASDPSKFFLLTSADQIVTAFNQIGTNLSKLRLAR